MKLLAAVLVLIGMASGSAVAATASGGSALAIAAIVGGYSPLLGMHDKRALSLLFDGRLNAGVPRRGRIVVTASTVVCRVSDVDITFSSCTLNFARRPLIFTGRKAHELYATLAEAGIPGDGAAGTIYESVSRLRCTLDLNEIRQRGGGGASCRFSNG